MKNKSEASKAFKSQSRQSGLQKNKTRNLTWVKGNRDKDKLDETSRKNLAAGRKPALGAKDFGTEGYASEQTGTSIFDPVLCELAYRWFCPPGGQVLDPFAGGSVRGIVAGLLGYKYHGIDLSKQQIAANELQWRDINGGVGTSKLPLVNPVDYPDTVTINISGDMLRQAFQPCVMEYITKNCKGRCCQGTGKIMVTVHRSEVERIEKLGARVVDGFIAADKRGLCPFKTQEGLCGIHGDEKPFGCQASPFTLNASDTLIVRNRYRLLKCYKGNGSIPAYKAHAWSLAQIFGQTEASRIMKQCEAGAKSFPAKLSGYKYAMLKDNDAAKHTATQQAIPILENDAIKPQWVVGDSLNKLAKAPAADFIFSCPPYGDLEVYSDDPADLSTMNYADFMKNYRTIIGHCFDKLRDNRFACFVVGEYRDKKSGNYNGFVPDTIAAFKTCGFSYFNEMILVTSVGSLPVRAGKHFVSGRKIGKTHQNVLVFVKGDSKKAAKECGNVEIFMPENEED